MRARRFVILIALTSACSATAGPAFDYQSRVGFAHARDTATYCLAIAAQDLRPGTQLTLADPSDSATVIQGVVMDSLTTACRGEGPGPPNRYYRHRYYYLGYDVEPSCEPKDYEGS
jgi:hypothetical protein